MKHLFAALLLVSFSSVLADTPAKIAEDYRKAAAAALVKLNSTLEQATVPLIAQLVKFGDTAGAEELRAQLKAKTAGEPVLKMQPSATLLFAQYDAARLKALEPAQKAAVARIEAMLNGKEGRSLDAVTELGKVRGEIEEGRTSVMNSFPTTWTYHKNAESEPMADLKLLPDGTWSLVDIKDKETTLGKWKQTGDTTAELDTGKLVWKLEYKGKSGVIVRPDIGNRYIKLVRR